MRTSLSILAACILLLIAAVPWIVSSCVSQPLLPEELRLERVNYENTVDASRAAEMRDQRQAPSQVEVIPLGTLAVNDVGGTPSPSGSPSGPATDQAGTAEPASSGTPVHATEETKSSVKIIHTAVTTQTPEPTRRIIVVHSGAETATPEVTTTVTPGAGTLTPEVATTVTPGAGTPTPTRASTGSLPGRPSGLIDVKDTITEAMLTEQINQDANDTSITGLTISLMPDGITASGTVTLFPRIKRPIQANGEFAVENDSLVVRITSIFFDGMDFTAQYGAQIESSVNSSLYRLLPQRYVDAYQLSFGQIVVYSKVRP